MRTVKRKKINAFKLLKMLCITLMLISIITVAARSSASGSTDNNFLEITVCRGDTLWDIAREYKTDQNIQAYIYKIMEMNNLDKADIFPGQKLKIPLNY